ncbi:MAG TPA: hypothetical protein VJ998_04920, partial [Pseudomonadales bacterium]|nr:hypothetical protein [Pseudomonadales bacterium]
MSYILDALNKSEKDKRQREATLPGLDTIHATPPPSAPTSGRRRFVAVIILIQAVIIGLGYWFVTRPHTQEVAIKPQSNPVPASTAPATPAMPPAQIPAARAGSKTAPVKPVPIRELPVDIQRQIPDLSFSSHIY